MRASGNAVSRFNVDQAQSNRDLAAADLEVARALLAQTDDQLARSRLTAPFDGVVSDRVRRAGEEVARGEVVARLVNPDELEIRLFVPLRHVRAIHPGHVVDVTSDQQRVHGGGQHASCRPAIRARSRSRCSSRRRPSTACSRPAIPSQVELPLGEPQRRLAVPRDALIIRADGLYVYRIDGDQRAERVPVKAGVADGDWIAVDGGCSRATGSSCAAASPLRGNEKLEVVGIFEEEVRRGHQRGWQFRRVRRGTSSRAGRL